jgi:hypothetical protein
LNLFILGIILPVFGFKDKARLQIPHPAMSALAALPIAASLPALQYLYPALALYNVAFQLLPLLKARYECRARLLHVDEQNVVEAVPVEFCQRLQALLEITALEQGFCPFFKPLCDLLDFVGLFGFAERLFPCRPKPSLEIYSS